MDLDDEELKYTLDKNKNIKINFKTDCKVSDFDVTNKDEKGGEKDGE